MMLNPNDMAKTMTIRIGGELPEPEPFRAGIRRAPDRGYRLTEAQTRTALKNALRYIPPQHHDVLIPEFLTELKTRGRIYGYRFRPHGPLSAKPVTAYKGNCLAGRAFQLMIDNNLDVEVALYPYELVTYGGDRQCLPELDAVPPDQKISGGPDRGSDPGHAVRPSFRTVQVRSGPTPGGDHQRADGGALRQPR